MKRSLLFISILLAAVSCNKEPVVSDCCENEGVNTVTINAAFAEELDTKSYIDNLKFYWNPGEKISVFFGANDNNTVFTAQNTEPAPKASFSGQISGIVGGEGSEAGNYVWALDPYDANAHCDGTCISASLKTQQTCVLGKAASDQVLTVAKSDNFYVSFYQVPTYGEFYLNTENVTSIDVKANDGSKIAGAFTVGFDGTSPVVLTRSGSDTVTLTPATGDYFQTGSSNKYYFSMLPGTFESGITFTFHTAELDGVRVIGASGMTMNRAQVHTLGAAGADDPSKTTWKTANPFPGTLPGLTEDSASWDWNGALGVPTLTNDTASWDGNE